MGVKGLWKLLDSTGKPIPVEKMKNKVLSIGILFDLLHYVCNILIIIVLSKYSIRYSYFVHSVNDNGNNLIHLCVLMLVPSCKTWVEISLS